jgi:hypothetical protein
MTSTAFGRRKQGVPSRFFGCGLIGSIAELAIWPLARFPMEPDLRN